DYPERDDACDYHIGLFHGEFSGESFAPANLTDMLAKDYNYWALGHIHLANHVADNVIYPGTPQGRNKKETTNLVVLGEMAPTGNLIYFRDLAEVHFETLTIDLSACQTLVQALTFIKSNLIDTATFYSLNLENYEAISDNLQEAVDNDELLEELRHGHVIVKLKLMPLSSENGEISKIVVPDLALPTIDLEQVYSLLPHKQEIRSVFEDADFQQEVQDNLTLFASQHFEFGGTLDEN
ncbi:MAG: metallophosphoesterase family protein, partial [Pseudolactococcus laudensis]